MRFCIGGVRPVTPPQGMPASVWNSSQSPDICTMGRSLHLGMVAEDLQAPDVPAAPVVGEVLRRDRDVLARRRRAAGQGEHVDLAVGEQARWSRPADAVRCTARRIRSRRRGAAGGSRRAVVIVPKWWSRPKAVSAWWARMRRSRASWTSRGWLRGRLEGAQPAAHGRGPMSLAQCGQGSSAEEPWRTSVLCGGVDPRGCRRR